MEQHTLDFGTPSRQLHRKGGPDTSASAAREVDTTKLEREVYEAISLFGAAGCISDEVRSLFPELAYSSVTARYRALLDKGYIVDTGQRRKGASGRGQRVMVAKSHHDPGP